MRDTLLDTVEFLMDIADRMDLWADESRSGGWSTHQVEANKAAANDCRRKAAELRLKARYGGAA